MEILFFQAQLAFALQVNSETSILGYGNLPPAYLYGFNRAGYFPQYSFPAAAFHYPSPLHSQSKAMAVANSNPKVHDAVAVQRFEAVPAAVTVPDIPVIPAVPDVALVPGNH